MTTTTDPETPVRNRPPLMPIAALVALALLAGCSGGDDDEPAADATTTTEATTTTTGPSPEEYAQAFSDVCVAVDADVAALADPQSYDELVDLALQAEGIVTDGVAALRALEGPDEVVAEAAAAIDALEREAAGFAALAKAAVAQDDAAIEAVGEASEANRSEAQAILDGVGIDCGFGGSADDGGGDGGGGGATPSSSVPAEPVADDLPPGEPPASVVPEYGTEPEWDDWADQCEGGEMVACDALFLQAEGGHATYGQTCGGRVPPHGPDDYCQQLSFSPGR